MDIKDLMSIITPEAHIVASREALRLFAAKLLAASLLSEGEDYVFNMQAEFGDCDYYDEIVIKVSETWELQATPIVYTWKERVEQVAAGLLVLFLMGAGIYKVYEWMN